MRAAKARKHEHEKGAETFISAPFCIYAYALSVCVVLAAALILHPPRVPA